MRLEQLHVYHLVRVLRVVLPFVVLALVAIPVVQYLDRPRRGGDGDALRLVQDMSDLTEQFEYSVVEGGRTSFTVEGVRYLGFRDGRSLGEDVDVVLYGEDGRTPAHRIHGDRCDYDQENRNIRCYGNVAVQFDARTTGLTEALEYDHLARTITTLSRADVTRAGEFEGQAERVRLEMEPDIIHLEGDARVRYEDGTILTAARVRHYQRELRVDAEGGLRVESPRLDVTAARAVLRLAGDPPRPAEVQAWEDVTAVSRADATRLTADHVRLRLQAGLVEDLVAEGRALLRSADRSLAGATLHGVFEAGAMVRIEAEDEGRMVFGDGDALESGRIRYRLAAAAAPGSVMTAGPSVLRVGGFVVRGADFDLTESDVVIFRTAARAWIESPDTRSTGLQTLARFDPSSKALLQLVQTGEAGFEQAERSGRADRLEVLDGGERIRLDGAAQVTEPRARIDAESIVLLNRESAFTAAGSVRAVAGDAAERIFVTGRTAEGDAASVSFTGGAELWRSGGHVSADRIDLALESRSFEAIGGVASTAEDVRAWADRMDFDESARRVHYHGNARLRDGELEVWARDVTAMLNGGGPERVMAVGDVRLRRGRIEGAGEEAVYTRHDEVVILSGAEAWVSSPEDGVVRGGRLRLELAAEAVTASGTEGGRVTSSRVLGP